jgi:hypothetical protein
MLETIKLIGCRSLRQLPAIHVGRQQDKPLAVVNCEKDWWDKLQWDGLEASRRLFSPRHSRYYKKNIPRGSLLRCATYLYRQIFVTCISLYIYPGVSIHHAF